MTHTESGIGLQKVSVELSPQMFHLLKLIRVVKKYALWLISLQTYKTIILSGTKPWGDRYFTLAYVLFRFDTSLY